MLGVILGVALASFLAGCAPKFYGPAYPPPSPPPQRAQPPAVSRPTLYVNANRLNLRACPGMDCPKIAVLERNDEVEKIGESEDWAQVRVKRDGSLGWVNTRYLTSEPQTPAPPVQEVTPLPPSAPPSTITPPPLPEMPPAAEKPKPAKLPETAVPSTKKKPEEARPPRAARPAEAAEPVPRKPKPSGEEAAPPGKPAPPVEKPAPSEPGPEQKKGIRIM